MKSLRTLFVDRIVRHKMAMQGIEVEEEWLDEDDDLVYARLPGYLQGPVGQMRSNALDLADSLLGLIMDRLQ